jgi:branched-chain amino acid transport system substrate-binding protein
MSINTSPTSFSPIRQMELASFNGESWQAFGDLMSG